MPNKEEFLQGKVKWCNTKHLGKFNKWGITLYPDAPSLQKVNKLIEEGIKNELKKDEDGYYISFSRPPEIKRKDGYKSALGPPSVIDKEGHAFDGNIGPGSDVGVKLETYSGPTPGGGRYKAARFSGLKIYNLVPMNPAESPDPRERDRVSGFDKQPDMPAW